jgi:predicted AAA+ superfamily ATPase
VINQFNPISLRADAGQLWENWFITERLKYLRNRQRAASSFFWRTLAKQEVDYVEEGDGKLLAIECKWGNAGRGKVSRAFSDRYPHAVCHIATPETVEGFLLDEQGKTV